MSASAALRAACVKEPRESEAPAVDLRDALPVRDNIYQVLFPKGGRTLGMPKGYQDRDFWNMAGFEIDRFLTPDFYRVRDVRRELGETPVEIWVNERKPADIVSRLAMAIPESGISMGNIGFAGSDTIDEFEHQRKRGKLARQFARIPLEKIMDTQMSRGAICLLVPEKFNILSLDELQGVDATAKYFAIADKFARGLERKDGISLRFIREAKGGTEDDLLLAGLRPDISPYAFVDIDFVQSGKSAVERNLRIAFMDAAKWDAIKDGRMRFDDMSVDEMKAERGVLATSSGFLIRPRHQFTPAQERINDLFVARAQDAIQKLGRAPLRFRDAEARPTPAQFRAGHGGAQAVDGFRPTYR
ncbi:MAG: hypothetical protein H6865_01485 [Rhodospirillales bacterium]|nr:hypothetical protein [Alphaproteobacteria bacterium]MCB9986295.1 hypothetical protein [Rhodospirillales bacterium]USO07152.1 MAG: hypothetical protein H6866_06900 [Rhodospirillales bacterium]